MSRVLRAGRRGFTLIEVLVALVIATMLGLMAHQVFAAAVEGSAVLERGRRALDYTSNAHRFLAAAFLSLEVGVDEAGPFEGDPDEVCFASWLQTPDGWPEREAAALRVEDHRLVMVVASAPPLVLADSVAELHLDYLLEPGSKASWVREWHSSVSAPLSVRLRLTRRAADGSVAIDTAIYLVKARG
jgi:prepilin-type N-terminal cleavage/methylation domain-containing protein